MMEKAASSVFSQIDALVETSERSNERFVSLPATIVERLEQDGVQSAELQKIVGSSEEICRLVDSKLDLTPDLADRVARLAHVINLAENVFGKREKAFLWLRSANVNLGGKPPIDLLDRETGARVVEETLMQIEYGVFA